jgi:alpha-tubulin suppressor-like RCC1 family protein
MTNNITFKNTNTIILASLCILFFTNSYSQNSMTGDGFGGRLWYVPHNYQVGSYTGYTVCGSNSQLYAWGDNQMGELGNGTFTSTDIPVAVPGMSDVKFYTTGYITAVIKTDSTAWVWGLGFPYSPTQILNNVHFADAGKYHVIFIKNDSTVWAAGTNESGQLGNGTILPSGVVTTPVNMTGVTNAVRVAAVGDIASSSASIILLRDGTVKVTGGNGFQMTNSTIPVNMPGLTNIVDIKGATYAAFALDTSGNVFSFGEDCTSGILGLGPGHSDCNFVLPTKITFPVGAGPIVALSSNNDGFSAMALDVNHNVYAWGNNNYGQLGNGTLVNQSSPVLVANNAVDIYAGETFSYILKADNTLWAAGQSGRSAYFGSIWMNLPNVQRSVFTQINPTIPPMNLCAPKVIPIQLLNFNCSVFDNRVNLVWASANESELDKFIIEVSEDGSSFQDIASIKSKGSNSTYNFVHINPRCSAFYRLRMIDKDGNYKYSEIRFVKLNLTANFTIVPNPAIEKVYIYKKNTLNIRSVQLMSVNGKLHKTIKNFNNGQAVNISDLPKGVYILKIISTDDSIEYAKFIKL